MARVIGNTGRRPGRILDIVASDPAFVAWGPYPPGSVLRGVFLSVANVDNVGNNLVVEVALGVHSEQRTSWSGNLNVFCTGVDFLLHGADLDNAQGFDGVGFGVVASAERFDMCIPFRWEFGDDYPWLIAGFHGGGDGFLSRNFMSVDVAVPSKRHGFRHGTGQDVVGTGAVVGRD